jgi:nucleotide-binding universal stress UspA family protein
MKILNIQNILVPIDFSTMSIQAVTTARRLARRYGAGIHLAHVRHSDYIATFSPPAPPFAPFPLMSYEPELDKSVIKKLNALAREHGISSAICHVLVGGPVFDEICRLAQKIPADLIMMPTHGRSGLKHVFLGSTAERIVQHSPCPVLVTRAGGLHSKNGSPVTVKTILVPVDFSDCSRKALEYAIGFVNGFGARLILLHATWLGYIYSSEGTAIYDVRGLQKVARENAERQMRNLVRAVDFGRTKIETVFTEGSPVIDICDFAKDHDVDLIITSTHGLTGLEHVLIGSIAEQVVRRAPCGVLVVPSHPHRRVVMLAKRSGRIAGKTTTARLQKSWRGKAPASSTQIA